MAFPLMKPFATFARYFQVIRVSTSFLALAICGASLMPLAAQSPDSATNVTTTPESAPPVAPTVPATVSVSTNAAPEVPTPAPVAAAPLTSPKPPGPASDPNTDTKKNIEYAKVGEHSLLLDLYVPKMHDKPVPLVIWIHGGGWREGSKDRPGLSGVLKSGMALASINYRLSQQAIFPAQLYDCKAAVRWLRAHAAENGINPDKIAVVGESAGGHLAALLGTTGQEPATEGDEGNPTVSSAVTAVVDFYGPTDFLAADFAGTNAPKMSDPRLAIAGAFLLASLLGGDPATKPDEAKFASPIYHITAKACPFFIAHGDRDALVPVEQSQKFDEALKKAGVESKLVIVPGKAHGFRDFKVSQDAVAFLKEKLGA